LNHVPAFGQDDAVSRHAPIPGGLGVTIQLPGFTVNWDEKFRSHGIVHDLQISLASVSGNMNARNAVIDYAGVFLEKVIHHSRDRLLIAGDLSGGKHDRVTRDDARIFMRIDSHSRER